MRMSRLNAPNVIPGDMSGNFRFSDSRPEKDSFRPRAQVRNAQGAILTTVRVANR